MQRSVARSRRSALSLSATEWLLLACSITTASCIAAVGVHEDLAAERIALILFLSVAAVLLGTTAVRLDAGVLTLGAIPVLTAVIVVGPAGATLVAASANLRRTLANRHRYRLPQFLTSTAWASMGAASRVVLAHVLVVPAAAAIAAVLTAVVANVVLTAILLSTRAHEPFLPVLRRGLSLPVLTAYGCFCIASFLCGSLLRPTATAVLQVSAIFFLSTFVIRSLNHQQARDRLADALAGADERAAFGHAMEAVLHRLKNLVALAAANLEEARMSRGDSARYVDRAHRALDEAGSVLRNVGVEGKTLFQPRFSELDLASLTSQLADEIVPLARQRRVAVSCRAEHGDFLVMADQGLIRDVLVNLVRNAVEHAGDDGWVDISCTHRPNGWPSVQVEDSGPGVPVSALDTLFVGRASETSTGAGLGLVASYLIVRQHYGKLFYEGRHRRGAIFTLELPPKLELMRRLGQRSRLASSAPP